MAKPIKLGAWLVCMPKTESECIVALQEAADILGESPTRSQYDNLGLRPATSTIMRRLGGWNEAKQIAGLQTFEQGENGGGKVQPKPEGVEIPDEVAWENLSGQQRWYYKNKDARIERKDQRRQELRRWLFEIKRDDLECELCGEARPPALDFHHPDEKHLGIAEMVNYGYSKESITEEISGCVVLCANCHRVNHYTSPNRP